MFESCYGTNVHYGVGTTQGWHGLHLDRKAIVKEMKGRIATLWRKEGIKPVE